MLTYKDFNTMEEKQLAKLDGIGRTVAKRIVANRPFRNDKDLLKIKGLGKKTLENLGLQVVKRRKPKDKTVYYRDGEIIDISTQAYAKDTKTGKIDYFWRIPKERRHYLG